MDPSTDVADVAPLPYHRRIVEYLKSEERDLWAWFASTEVQAEQAASMRLELLKSTYRLERSGHAELYTLADDAARKLGVDAPLTLYQAQGGGAPNASLAFVPGEPHIVFSGPLRERLGKRELQSVLAHELAHFVFSSKFDAELLVARDILAALVEDEASAPVFTESLRVYSLHTEVFCDRAALVAVGDLHAVISALLKIETGSLDVDADSYLRQAREIFAHGPATTDGLTHPEAYIRAYALERWQEAPGDADAIVEAMLRGVPRFDRLDLIGRHDLALLTRRLIRRYLVPPWLRTDATLAHARLFDPAFEPADGAGDGDDSELGSLVRTYEKPFREYFAFVLLDLAASERALEDVPLAAALCMSAELGFGDELRAIAERDLPLTKKALARVAKNAAAIVREAASVKETGA